MNDSDSPLDVGFQRTSDVTELLQVSPECLDASHVQISRGNRAPAAWSIAGRPVGFMLDWPRWARIVAQTCFVPSKPGEKALC